MHVLKSSFETKALVFKLLGRIISYKHHKCFWGNVEGSDAIPGIAALLGATRAAIYFPFAQAGSRMCGESCRGLLSTPLML